MKFIIKEDHPIVQFIFEEVENSWERFKNNIGICTPILITERPIVSTDIYGFRFNSNNWDVRVINIAYFSDPKIDNASKILNRDVDGYEQYTYYCNTCIKLKTFLEKHKQWSQNIDEWMIPVIEDKIEARTMGYNSKNRTASIRLPNDKDVEIKIPEELKNSDVYEWHKSEAKKMTLQYYREEALNEALNIKKDRYVYVNGFWFKYDYIDGIVEIHDIRIGAETFSQYKNLMSLFELKNDAFIEIKKQIESGDLEVKEIKIRI